MSQSEFNLMSPRQFLNAMDGWVKRVEFQQRKEWERARFVAKAIVTVLVPKKERAKLKGSFVLPWEKESAKKRNKLAYDDSPEVLRKLEEEALNFAKKIK